MTILLITSCDLIGELDEDGTEYVRKSQIEISDLKLLSSKNDLIKFLGRPDSVVQGYYFYDRLNTYLAMDSLIWEVTSTNPDYSTPDGIKVGNSKKKVINAYGETETWEHEDKSGETLVYWNYHTFQQTPLYLFFSIREDTVSEIKIRWHWEWVKLNYFQHNNHSSMGVPWTSRIRNLLLRRSSALAPNGAALLYCAGINTMLKTN